MTLEAINNHERRGSLLPAAIAAALSLAHMVYGLSRLGAASNMAARRAAAAGAYAWWDGGGAHLIVLASVVGIALTRALVARPAFKPRTQWILVAVLLAALALADVAALLQPPSSGFAQPGGVTWFKGERIVQARRWEAATAVSAGCLHVTRSHRQALTYDVAFGRSIVPLGLFGGPPSRLWVEQATAVDQAIPKSASYSHLGLEGPCLVAMISGLPREDAKALIRLLRPKPYNVAAIRRESPEAGMLVAEVVAEGR